MSSTTKPGLAPGFVLLRWPAADAFDYLPHRHRSRVFGIDVETCIHCGGQLKIVASVEEPQAIRAILVHFEKHGALEEAHYRPAARAPPAEAA